MSNILEQVVKEIDTKKKNVSDLLDILIRNAFDETASDIHIEQKEDKTMLFRYRIDGILHDIFTVNKKIAEDLIFIIKVKAKLRTDVHFAPQDGKIGFVLEKAEGEKPVKIDARVSIVPITHGEKIVIRLLSQQSRALTLEELGFSKTDLEKVQRSYRHPYGLILSTGPTGSGKTTTLYSILSILNSREVNITTVEEPVEFSITGINHIQINTKVDLTFANGLRSILRQDPNVIMVGEVRDNDTAKITLNAALTGHLVLSTLHANNTISTIPRLLNLGVEPFLLATTLNIIISQRLGRRLCSKCKKEYTLGKDLVQAEMLKLRPDIAKYLKPTDKLYKAIGCDACKKRGYKGRIGIYELLEITPNIREALAENMNTEALYNLAKKEGFRLMIEDGIEKVKHGDVDISELMKVISIKE
jgi:type II secretory ATPase GspE/PulE/Tfp pilus assembly ATPase PilB-like protein